jgi:hypothetical protein
VGQIILDEQIFDTEVLIPLTQWITVQRLRDLRPDQVIEDERVPMILRELQTAKQAWIAAAMVSGKPIPEPRYRSVT